MISKYHSSTFSVICKATIFIGLLVSGIALAAPDGEFRVPTNNQTFDGNLMFGGTVTDPDGSGALIVRINGDDTKEISLCSDCFSNSNTRNFVKAGINPRDMQLSSGSHFVQLIEIDNGSETEIDRVNFRWEPPQVTGISVNRTIGNITISWNSVAGYNRYNLYISSEANITPDNIDSLPDGTTFLGINGTSQSISNYADDLGLFALVTASNASGEGAYSEIFRIEALDNQDPEVISESFTLDEDGEITDNLLANDSDPEEQPLSAELNAEPSNGNVTLDSNGDFTYKPFLNFNGEDAFSYLVSDPQGGSQLGSVAITVRPVNDAPVAESDAYQLAEDTVLNVTTADGVLTNDSDVDSDGLIASLINSTQNGIVNLNSDGSFTYHPTEHFFGSDSFTYSASDPAGASSTSSVTLVVSPVNDPPVATDDSYQMNEDQTLIIDLATQGLLANDSDAELTGDERFSELTVTLLSSPDNGELDLQSNGTFQYTPATDFFGTVTFIYQVTDPQGASASATVSIEVVDQPESAIAQDDAYVLDEDTSLTVQASDGVLANDSNVDANDVSLTVLTSTASGQLNVNNDGSFSYQPAENFNGIDSFSYRVSNSIGSDEALVTLTINAINDAPIVIDDIATTIENTAVTISPLDNDNDPDGDALSVSISSVSDGTAVVQENNIVFTPATNFVGDATINYLATDNQGGETNGVITISVIAQNEPPIAADDNVQTDEDAPVTIAPLANDTDPDGDPLTLSILAVSSGSADLNANNTIIYTPVEDFNGTATISYQIADEKGEIDQAVITVTVNPVNDDPIALDDEVSVAESETVILMPLSNDSDVDGDALSITSVTASTGTALFTSNEITYTAPDTPGIDSISYTISDGNGATATATIGVTITNVQDAPVAVDDAVTTDEDTSLLISPLDNDSDEDGDTLSVTIESVSNGTADLESSTSIRYTPTADFFGTAAIVYTATDEAGNTDSANVIITVNPVNDDPIALDDEVSVAESETVILMPLNNDSDVDGDELSITSVTASTGTVSFTSNEVTYTAPDTPGIDSISYTISDGNGATATATIGVTITNVQDAPVAVDDAVTTDEDTSLLISPLENDSDEDGDTLSVTIESVSNGTADLESSTSIRYTPTADFFGTAAIVYTATDEAGNTDSANIFITVNPVNDDPIALDDEVSVAESETVILMPLNNDSDVDGDELSITSVTASTGTVSFTSNEVTYTAPDTPGIDSISYTISDGNGATATATIGVTITNVQDAPVAVDDAVTTDEDTSLLISPLDNDSDEDGDTLSVTIESVSNGTADLESSTSIRYTPTADFFGTAAIVYTATDEAGNTDSANIIITVNPVNDAPDAVDDNTSTDEDVAVTLSPLNNDSDVDNDSLSYTISSTTNGTAVINSDDSLTYTPATDFNGLATINYTLSDENGATDSASIFITVNSVNDAPIATDDTISTNEDNSVVISPLENDSDADGDTLSLSINAVSNGSAELISDTSIRFTPSANFFGTANVSYIVSDGSGDTDNANITITVNSVNDAPDANNDSVSTNEDTAVVISPLDNDTDVENDSLTLTINSTSNGSSEFNSDTSITFIPETDFNGTAAISYSISDGNGGTDTADISITVISVNDAPVAVADAATVDQGSSIVISPLDNDSDIDGDDLTISSANASNGNVEISSDAKTITYTASSSFSGTDTITYVVNDGTDSDSGSISVTVNDVNETPVASNDEYDVNAGESADLDVLSNDTDGDGDTLTITEASATLGTVTISTDASSLSYTAPSDTTTTDTVSYTISDPSSATASATATINITEQTFSGEFDSDGDGNSDISASTDGTDYTVTFGDNVDAVYYEEDGSYVSVSANDDGSYELTIEGSNTSGKQATKLGGIKMQANRDFVLPSSTNTVFYTIDGVEYSFTVSNLDQPNANVAFGPPTQLNNSFEGVSSHDFYVRQVTFSGPLRFGVENGEHYILAAGGSGTVRGADFDGNVTWQDNSGILIVNIDAAEEFEQQYNVFDLDDDNSDGIALNIITKAEADAYVTAYKTEFVTVNITDARQEFRFLKDNRIYIDAEIDVFYQYRIDSSLYPEITSANDGVVETIPSETQIRQLWNIDSLKLQKLTFSDISAGIATEIPRLANNTFETFAADFCLFTETTTGSGTGSGFCQFSSQSFTWNISNDVLNMDFGNEVTAAYRWLDDLIVENTFSIELTVGSGANSEHYSKHVYWLTLTNISDADISNLLSGRYFDSATSKSNPDARNSDNSVKTSNTEGFYFDGSGLGKYLTSRTEFDGTSVIDTDRRWEVNSGQISIFSQSTLSSGNGFSYEYDQCIDNGDASCFIWQIQLWVPIAVSGNRIWVWEWLLVNDTGPFFDTTVNYEEQIKPRIQYYELNNSVPGAPNSISFNQEPIWQSIDFNTDINVSVSNLNVLNYFADPESDPIAILDAAVEQGTLSINDDNSVNYIPPTDFIGDIKYYLEVSDSINSVYASGTITVLSENFAPVAVDDSYAALSGIAIALTPLDNDTDANSDPLTITSATSDTGVVTVDTSNTQLIFTAPATFSGNATLTYFISDGRSGSDSASITVNVSQPSFNGGYDFNNSTIDDFSITSSAGEFRVVFGDEVSAVFYEINGQTHIVSRNADGYFEFVYNAGDTNIAQLQYVINGFIYQFAPDDLSLSTPNLVYSGETEIINDFISKNQFLLISRQPTNNSALATAFKNGELYDLASNGTGLYSSPTHTDSVSWVTDTDGTVTVSFNNPVSEVIYYFVYDLDDEFNNDGALGVITKAEADAYVSTYNDFFVPVNITTIAHKIDTYALQGYFYEANIGFVQSFQIDSISYPEITSAQNGVVVESGGENKELLNVETLDFLTMQTSDILGTIYVPVAIEDGSGNFQQFASDICTLSESSTGSNVGTAACSITGNTASWSIESDGSLSVDFGNSLSAVYRWLDHGDIENTLFIKAQDINGDIYSNLDYWLQSDMPSASDVSSLINGNYLEISDNITNRYNYDKDGLLNDSIGNGFYFAASGLAKSLNTFLDSNNDITVQDNDRRWQIDTSGLVSINALSNLSSGDTFHYQFSQCTDSADASCYVWLSRTWIPLAIQNNRLWVMEYEETDPDNGYFDSRDGLEVTEYPKIRFYELRSAIPGVPNSISFNQAPVFNSNGLSTVVDTVATFNLLNDLADPEGDSMTIIDARVNSGTIIVNTDNSVTFTPESAFIGSVFMDFTVDDGINRESYGALISVFPANTAPIASDDTVNAIGSHSYSFSVLDNDIDADNDLLNITNLSTTATGFSISSDAAHIEYNAPASLTATEIVTYTISDGNGGSDTATLTVSLVPNSDPIVNNDNAGPILSGSTITLTPLDNDTDPDGDFLTILTAASSDGVVSIAIDGQSLDFSPTISSGTASLNYTTGDGFGGSATGVISVAVTSSNNAPTDILIDGTSSVVIARNNTGINALVGSLTTTDADTGDSHNYSLVNIGTSASGTCSASSGNGSFAIDGSQLRSSTTLAPAVYDVCVQTNDGSTTFQKTLSISVTNNAPTDILIDGTSSVVIARNNTGINALVGSLTTTDADTGDSHNYSLVNIGTSASGTCSASSGNGSFAIDGSQLRSSTTLAPAVYDVCVQTNDGSTTFQKTLSISVTNNAPTDILIDGTSSVVIARNNTGINALVGSLTTTDADTGDSHNYSLVNIGTSASGTCSASSGNGSFAIDGSQLRSSTTLAPAVYDVCVQTNDGSTTFQKTLSISVTNNAPTDILIDGTSSVVIARNNTGINALVGSLTTTDADTGDSHNYSLVNIGTSASGTCSASSGNGNFAIDGSQLRSSTTLAPAVYDVCVQTNDGSTTFQKTLSISVTNNAPTDILIDGNAGVTLADSTTGINALMGTLSTTDADTGDSHSYTLVNIGTSDSGTCTASSGNGSFNIDGNNLRSNSALSATTYNVCVQTNDTSTTFQKTLSITVTSSNNAPTDILLSNSVIDDIATGTDVVVGSLSTTDVDTGDAHTYSLVTAGTSANGTCSADTGNSSFNINGSDLRTNTALSAATYNVCLQSSDGSTTYEETLSITVNIGNSAPTDILIDGGSSDTIADGDTGTNAIIGAFSTTDVDGGDTHSYSLVSTGASTNGTCSSDTDNSSFNIDGTNLRSNAALSAASYNVCLESNDGTTSFQTTLNVTVTSNTPVATADSYILLSASGMTASIDSTVGVLANDSDPNSDTLTVSIVTNPANDSAFTLNSDGSFSYQHNGSTVLTDSFVYQVSDGTYSSQATASLTIKRANFVPGICTTPEAYTQAGENFSQTIQVLDLDGDSQTFTVSGEPTWMSLATIDGNTATLSGTPSTSDVGTSSITFNSTDGYATESLTFDLTVIDEFAVSNNADIEFGGTTEVVYDAVIDNYGNIVVVGTSDGDFAVTRLLRDGSIDSSFNSGLVYTYDFGGTNDVAISVKVRPDNGLVIAGHTNVTSASDNDYALMVLKEDGTLDTSFSSDGVHTIDPSFGYDDFLAEALLHENGDITLIGQSFVGPYYNLSAVQLDSSGAVDAGFNSGSTLSISGVNDLNPEAAIEDGEGNIYVIGHGSNGTNSDIFMTRFSVETGASNDFAKAETNAPIKYLNDGGNEYGYDLAFDANGSVLVAGTKDNDFALYKFAITWDNTNSEWDVDVDTSFNSSTGKNIIDLNSSSTDFAYSMVSDKRGNYYIAGKQGTDTSIIRISADGTLDTGYGTGGVKTITLSSGVSNTPTIIRTDALGQLLIFDTEDAGSDAHVAITFDYILDPPTFGDCDYTSEFQATSNKTQDEVVDASIASDNDYFVAGWSLGQDDSNKDFVVVKTDSNGDFDALWGENGYARIDAGASTSITPYDAIGLANTEVVIAGVITGTDDLYLAKLNGKGELDSGFDSDGIRDLSGTVDLTPAQGLYVSSASAFLIAGKDSTNSYSWVYRFNTDGTDDLSFGAGTNVSTSDTGVNYTVYSDANFSIYDMVTLTNGDIYLVGGYFDTYNKVALIKMDSAGLIDTSFGASGLATFDQGSAHVGFKAATDGTAIYILGKDTSSSVVSVLKVDSSGNLDTSFDSDGIAELADYQISASSTSSIQIDSSGAIWLQVSKSGTNESMVRLTSTGGLDINFINAGNTQFSHGIDSWTAIAGFQLNSSNEALLYGTVSTDFALAGMSNIGEVNNTNHKVLFDLGYGEHATSIALDEYSGVYLAGYGRNTTDYDDDMAIAKFDNTGAGSNSFGSYGQTTSAIELFTPNGGSTQFKDISLSANGHIFTSGESILSGANTDIYNAKISADAASIDTTSYGSGLTDISGSSSDDLVGGHYQADDGYLYVVGSTDGKALVYRYNYSGNFDSSFNAATGTLELSTYTDSHFTAITPTSDGNLVAVGYYSNGGDIDALIVKFSPEGSLDSSFSNDGIYEFQVASTEERFYDVAIDGNGTIYAVGESNGDAIVIAMDNTATAATSWNSTGDLSYDVNSGSDDIATAIKVDAFGAIFVLVNSNNEFALLRFKPDGTLISDFGGTNGYSAINKMRDIAIDTLGNVFVTGSTQLDQQWQFFTVRYTNVVGPY
ncbi:Ig-like domain-containing protein [Planctobacterium marinum]|uniref:Cadherin domain-containing protein n=1 Tax=Planctobacterium marinum TaxID=1631968 RepID=A0AA48HLR6_9ALTE|nr:hypothetical protein MACH26_30900 [Planctobacterium marinum]